MFNKKEFLKEEERCAKLLGMNLREYNKFKKDNKISKRNNTKKRYDNSILKKLGLKESDLKVKKNIV